MKILLERFEEFSFAIYDIQRCWSKTASDGMELYGLKGSYAAYLIAMKKRPEGITAAQLGSLCGRDKADVSRAAAVLESKGFIKKESGSGNLYRAKLVLTPEGEFITDSIIKKALIAEQIAGNGVTEEERESFYRTLEKVRDNMRRLAEEGIPAEEPEGALGEALAN